MKQWWEKQSLRIDNLSLRERVLLFFSVIVACFVFANTIWLSPTQLEQQQLKQRMESQSGELSLLRAKLQGNAKPVDVNAALREQLEKAQTELAAMNQEVQALATSPDKGSGLERVLVQFLRREEGLTLLGVTTMQPEASMKTDAEKQAPAETLAKAAVTQMQPSANAEATGVATRLVNSVHRRGLELKVAGPYAALQRYVKTLETSLPNLRWGLMQLKSTKQATELTLQVFIVEVES